jgi:hypothetical protein
MSPVSRAPWLLNGSDGRYGFFRPSLDQQSSGISAAPPQGAIPTHALPPRCASSSRLGLVVDDADLLRGRDTLSSILMPLPPPAVVVLGVYEPPRRLYRSAATYQQTPMGLSNLGLLSQAIKQLLHRLSELSFERCPIRGHYGNPCWPFRNPETHGLAS